MPIRESGELEGERQPIGFSPRRDADFTVWGVILRFDRASVTVEEISPLGEPDGEQTYRLAKIAYWDNDPAYSDRLVRLGSFRSVRPNITSFESGRKMIRLMLAEAAETGQVLRIRLRSEYGSRAMRASFCEREWVGLTDFDDLMRETGR